MLNTTAVVTSTLAWEDFLKCCHYHRLCRISTAVKTWNKCCAVQLKPNQYWSKRSLERIITIRVVFLGWTTRLRWASWMWTWTTMSLIWASECWRPCVYIAETHVLCPYLSNLTKLTNQIETEILLQIQIQIHLQKNKYFYRDPLGVILSVLNLLETTEPGNYWIMQNTHKINSNSDVNALHIMQCTTLSIKSNQGSLWSDVLDVYLVIHDSMR